MLFFIIILSLILGQSGHTCGWDPNEVTRAGYGSDVKVQTQYTNDWETKVPSGASAHGGTYKRPMTAPAYFYEIAGRFVESVAMEATQGIKRCCAVVVYIEGAGKHEICLIRAKKAAIYGVVFDAI